MMRIPSNAVVFDHTALLALGKGTPMLSGFVDAAHRSPDQHVFVPALCLVAATAERPALADHIGGLPGLEIVDLSFAAASAVGRLIANGADWRTAQAISTALPDPEWPDGRPVLAAVPKHYDGRGIAAIMFPN
jgi:hypothetical protein